MTSSLKILDALISSSVKLFVPFAPTDFYVKVNAKAKYGFSLILTLISGITPACLCVLVLMSRLLASFRDSN